LPRSRRLGCRRCWFGIIELSGHVSAWWRLFEALPKYKKRVICRLDDGSMVEGWLSSYNVEPEETGDRELILGGQLAVRHPDGQVQRTE
jgi:Family of unknown function (DUF6338)